MFIRNTAIVLAVLFPFVASADPVRVCTTHEGETAFHCDDPADRTSADEQWRHDAQKGIQKWYLCSLEDRKVFGDQCLDRVTWKLVEGERKHFWTDEVEKGWWLISTNGDLGEWKRFYPGEELPKIYRTQIVEVVRTSPDPAKVTEEELSAL